MVAGMLVVLFVAWLILSKTPHSGRRGGLFTTGQSDLVACGPHNFKRVQSKTGEHVFLRPLTVSRFHETCQAAALEAFISLVAHALVRAAALWDRRFRMSTRRSQRFFSRLL